MLDLIFAIFFDCIIFIRNFLNYVLQNFFLLFTLQICTVAFIQHFQESALSIIMPICSNILQINFLMNFSLAFQKHDKIFELVYKHVYFFLLFSCLNLTIVFQLPLYLLAMTYILENQMCLVLSSSHIAFDLFELLVQNFPLLFFVLSPSGYHRGWTQLDFFLVGKTSVRKDLILVV